MRNLSSNGQLKAPDQEQVERELRNAFDYGDIKAVSATTRVPYSTLTKQLNPDCIEESPIFQALFFLYGCEMVSPALEEKVWAVLCRYRAKRGATQEAADELGTAVIEIDKARQRVDKVLRQMGRETERDLRDAG